MKKQFLVIILSTLVSFSVMAASATKEISEKNKALVLKYVDDICGDTWCEGDYKYEFDSFEKLSDGPGYVLNFRLRLDEDQDWTEASCESPERIAIADFLIIEKTPERTYYKLNKEYYQELTECVSDAESQVDHTPAVAPEKSKRKSTLMFY